MKGWGAGALVHLKERIVLSLVREIVTNWRASRQYRERFLESADEHIGKIKEDKFRFFLFAGDIFFACLDLWDTIAFIFAGILVGALVHGIYCGLMLFAASLMLKLPQMLHAAHEYALNHSDIS